MPDPRDPGGSAGPARDRLDGNSPAAWTARTSPRPTGVTTAEPSPGASPSADESFAPPSPPPIAKTSAFPGVPCAAPGVPPIPHGARG